VEGVVFEREVLVEGRDLIDGGEESDEDAWRVVRRVACSERNAGLLTL
jgi:hypothetical protein